MSSKTTENEQTNRRIAEEMWTEGNLSVADDLYTEDCLLHVPGRPVGQGPEAIKAWVKETRTAFPDMSITLTQTFSCEGATCGTWTMAGTHEGEMARMGIPPTGEEIEMTGLYITRMEGGRIAEEWNVGDTVGMLTQMGVLETDR